MPKPKFVEHFARGAGPALSDIVEALPYGLMGVGAGHDVEKALVGCGIVEDRFRFAVHGEHDGALVLFELPHELTRITAEGGHRMNIFCDVDHEGALPYL
jgi:hypothetical protein